jgi:hypothetical protein
LAFGAFEASSIIEAIDDEMGEVVLAKKNLEDFKKDKRDFFIEYINTELGYGMRKRVLNSRARLESGPKRRFRGAVPIIPGSGQADLEK